MTDDKSKFKMFDWMDWIDEAFDLEEKYANQIINLRKKNEELKAQLKTNKQINKDIKKSRKLVSTMFKLTPPQMVQLWEFLSSHKLKEKYNSLMTLEDELKFWLEEV